MMDTEQTHSGTPHMSGNISALFAAKAQARKDFELVLKDRQVTVYPKERDGRKPPPYTFEYATLGSVIAATEKALSLNGLDITHIPFDASDGSHMIRHILAHADGGIVTSTQRLGPANMAWQEVGSAQSYSMRYFTNAVLHLSADIDDDGNAADGNQVAASAPRQQKTPVAERASSPSAPVATTGAPPREKEGNSLGRAAVVQPVPVPAEKNGHSADTLVDAAPSEPLTEATNQLLHGMCVKLGLKGGETAAICKNVTGKLPKDLTEAGAAMLSDHLRKLATERGVSL